MSLKSEALQAIEDDIVEVTTKATTYMRGRVGATCNQGYATGRLEGSIVNERIGRWEWRVGSHLPYASYVNDGRGWEYPRIKNGSLYLKPPLDFWMPPGRPVAPMEGKKFIEDTKQYIEDIVLY